MADKTVYKYVDTLTNTGIPVKFKDMGDGTFAEVVKVTALANGGSSWTMNADGSVSGSIGVAAKGYTLTGTQPAAANPGTAAGTFWSTTAPNGGNALSGANNGGTGGLFAWTAGNGGNASGAGTGGAGGGFTYTTGNAGTGGNVAAGDFIVNLGQGTGTGRGGEALFQDSVAPGTTYTTITKLGIGLGTQAVNGRNYYAIPTYTDPTFVVAPMTVNQTIVLTANSTQTMTASDFETWGPLTNNITGNGYLHGLHGEAWHRGSGTMGKVLGSYALALTLTTSTGPTTYMAGGQSTVQVSGTGLVTTAIGHDAYVILSPSGGAVDGNITSGYGYQASFQNLSTAATPGVFATFIGLNVTSPLFATTGTPSVTTIYGVNVNSLANTYLNTSTSGAFTTYGYAVTLGNQGGNTTGTVTHYGFWEAGAGGTAGNGGAVVNLVMQLNVPNPVSVTGGTNTNTALRIDGNGGTGPGTNNNWAIRCTSLAASIFAGSLAVGTTVSPAASTFQVASGFNTVLGGLITNYNNVATAGYGVAAIRASGRPATQTNTTTTITSYANPATDASYEIRVNVNVTVSTTVTMTVTCTYTDEANVARTLTIPFYLLAGTQVVSITTAQGNIPYESVPITIRVKASTTISLQTAGTVTAVTYTCEGRIVQGA